jgi:Transposase and inactivated derivatives
MKIELPASWEKIYRETGSTRSVVNPAYTWQMCSQTGTLLGKRDGEVFTAYTGVVIQSDKNAALNILYRSSDSEINPWMKYAEVRKVLLLPTVRYLTGIGKSVTEAWDLGWINPKLKAEALGLEDEYHRQG